MSVKLYMTTVTTNREIYIHQSRIKIILEGKNIKYEEIDLAKDKDKRNEMRELAGVPDLLPPQIFNGTKYCGVPNTFQDTLGKIEQFRLLSSMERIKEALQDYQAINDANEDGKLMEFLLLK